MKPIKADLPSEINSIELHPFADFHLGDMMSDFTHITAMIEHIKNTPNAYCILNGDMMDTAIASSVGDTYGANLQPMEQLKQAVMLFAPIKSKILCVTPGNHENRVYRTDGIDMTHLMCAQLDIENLYTPTTAALYIRFGRNHKGRKTCYTVYVTHGSGGGRKEGGKINRLSDLTQIVDADIYIHSHTHLPAAFKSDFCRLDVQNSTVQQITKLFVNTSSQLNYGGYGDAQGYKPSCKDNPVILLKGDRKEMQVLL